MFSRGWCLIERRNTDDALLRFNRHEIFLLSFDAPVNGNFFTLNTREDTPIKCN